jgi:uncharacterized protein (TIGR03790 family)
VVLAIATLPSQAGAQTGANVLVVINQASPASVEVGEYYATLRQVPSENVVRISAPTTDAITRQIYEESIQQPLGQWLTDHDIQDRVLYIVLTKDVPLRIAGTAGLNGTMASVDSELTLLYRRLVGLEAQTLGRVENPYFLGDRELSEARPFTRHASDLYLVTRLDGFSVTDVRRLIERSLQPSREGIFVLDQRGHPEDRLGADRWLEQAADRIDTAVGMDRRVLETTRARADAGERPVLGYYTWGSNDPGYRQRESGARFAPGSLAGMFVSTDGRTFTPPPAGWQPTGVGVGGYGSQSLAGDLVREGITGVAAHVAEPYLDAAVRPQILFPAYLAGLNLAEAYYAAIPFLSWQTIVIGDPLTAPFRMAVLAPSDLFSPVDARTSLPGIFSERLVARLTSEGQSADGVRLQLKGERAIASGDTAAGEALLAQAFALEPRLLAVGLRLGGLHELRGDYAKAVDIYRIVLNSHPENVIALNNLAFALGEKLGQPKEALPYAERAMALANLPEILDTAGWLYHLTGDDATANRLLERAAALAPAHVDILVRAATVAAAVGDRIRARRQLDAAIKADPKAAEREDVIALRARIGGLGWRL